MVHTENCSGRGQAVVFDYIGEADVAVAQADQCPAACSAVPSGHHHGSGEGMRLPERWKRGDQEHLDYVLWFLDRYGLSLDTGWRPHWDNVSGILPSVETGRYLLLYAFAWDQMPCELWSIDVNERASMVGLMGCTGLGVCLG